MKRYAIVKTAEITRNMYDENSYPVSIEGTEYSLLTLFEEHPTALAGYKKYSQPEVPAAVEKIKTGDLSEHKELADTGLTTGELRQGTDYDRIDIAYPDTSTEAFTYSKNGVEVLTVTVSYQTTSKRNINSVVYS
jgi:hypothetical protein